MEDRNPNNDDLINVDIGEKATQAEADKTFKEPGRKKSKKNKLK
jgi:hypothetical protein